MKGVDLPQYPKREEIQDALQLLLYNCGGDDCVLRAASTYEPLADYFKLSPTARMATNSTRVDKQPYWCKCVQFARLALVEKGDLHRMAGRGFWKLTKQGKRRAATLESLAPGLRANNAHSKSHGMHAHP